MKTKQEIVEAYKRYLASLNGKSSDIIGNFDAIYKHITNNCEGEIYQALLIDCIGKTIKAVKENGLRLKDMASEWNKASIDRFFEILGNIEKARKTEDWDTYKINEYYLFKLCKEEESPHTRLYMYIKHSESIDGYNLYKSNRELVKELFNAKTEEEIEEILEKETLKRKKG